MKFDTDKVKNRTREALTQGAKTGVASVTHTALIDSSIMALAGEHKEVLNKLPVPVRELLEALVINALANGFENLPHAKKAEYVSNLVISARARDVTELYLADKIQQLTTLFNLFGEVKVP
jgi:hypothetical protein